MQIRNLFNRSTIGYFKKFTILSGLILLALSISPIAKAQDLDQLAKVNVDELSDQQIKDYMEKAQMNGLSEDQLERAALARGMTQDQVQKLKTRIEHLKSGESESKTGKKPVNPYQKDFSRYYNFGEDNKPKTAAQEKTKDSITLKMDEVLEKLTPKIFGADLFSNKNLTFEPDLKLPTPKNYQLGPDDELVIDLSGYVDASYKVKISPDGTIRIPQLAPINVSGLTVEQASEVIIKRLSQIHAGLRDGTVTAQIALGSIRSIKVTLVGEVTLPGTYTLPSLATIFNALYASGGPSENGSFRNIELVRNNKIIAHLDVYDFLLKGDQKDNLRLQDQDVIRVGAYINRVSMFGEVKNPGYYEAKEGEMLQDLIKFAGGFTDKAYSERIKVLKKNKRERGILDLEEKQFASYQPQNGDRYIVESILNKYANRVILKGAVYREGPYELEQNLTILGLLKKADGVRGDAFTQRAYIKRTREDRTTEIISFNLNDLINGKQPDIQLLKDDEINIPSALDLKEPYIVTIQGEVLKPGQFPYSDNMSVEDLVVMAGGLKESAFEKRVSIARRVKNDNADVKTDVIAETIHYDLSTHSVDKNTQAKFTLQPFDIVVIRKAPGYEEQKLMNVEGEVLYPGIYAISKKTEKISDIIIRAGGLTPDAFADGAVLVRKNKDAAAEKELLLKRLKKLGKTNKTKKDSATIDVEESVAEQEFVGINLRKIIKSPGSKYDLYLEEGDVLRIPKQLQTVKVQGEVLYPISVRYISGKRLRFYVSQAGGFSESAKKGKAYVLNPNGSVNSTRKILFFNSYPKVNPGAQVVIPKKAEVKGLSTQEILGITTATSSMALILITIVNLVKK